MEPELNDLRLFVEVAKLKSFRRAADVLGVPNPTISRRVKALEKAIGLRLLHRTTRKVELTEAGQAYYDRCKHIVLEARLAHEQLGIIRTQPSGLLRASFPVDFAVTYLTPIIVEFANLYPDISFDFDLTPRKVDLISEPFDVAIRIGNPDSSQMIARRLVELPTYLYASPGYLARMGDVFKPSDLKLHTCLAILNASTWTLHGDTTITVAVGSSRFHLNSIGMLRQLAVLDMGIILMPEQVVAGDLANGKLRRILPTWQGNAVPVYSITETRLIPAKTHCFIEFLRNRLASPSICQKSR